jgi:hypothetical protein
MTIRIGTNNINAGGLVNAADVQVKTEVKVNVAKGYSSADVGGEKGTASGLGAGAGTFGDGALAGLSANRNATGPGLAMECDADETCEDAVQSKSPPESEGERHVREGLEKAARENPGNDGPKISATTKEEQEEGKRRAEEVEARTEALTNGEGDAHRPREGEPNEAVEADPIRMEPPVAP